MHLIITQCFQFLYRMKDAHFLFRCGTTTFKVCGMTCGFIALLRKPRKYLHLFFTTLWSPWQQDMAERPRQVGVPNSSGSTSWFPSFHLCSEICIHQQLHFQTLNKDLYLQLENWLIHIFALPCNILYLLSVTVKSLQRLCCLIPIVWVFSFILFMLCLDSTMKCNMYTVSNKVMYTTV